MVENFMTIGNIGCSNLNFDMKHLLTHLSRKMNQCSDTERGMTFSYAGMPFLCHQSRCYCVYARMLYYFYFTLLLFYWFLLIITNSNISKNEAMIAQW